MFGRLRFTTVGALLQRSCGACTRKADPVAKHLLRRCQLPKVLSSRLYCRGLERGVLLLGPNVIKATSSKQGSVDGAIPRELLAASGCVALVQVHKGIARSYYPQSSHMQLILNCSLIPFSFSRSLALDSTRASCSKRVRNVGIDVLEWWQDFLHRFRL